MDDSNYLIINGITSGELFIINSQNYAGGKQLEMMECQNRSLAGSNQSCQMVKEEGQFNIMGNSNIINLKQCQGQLNIMGNANQISLIECKIELILNGNGNIISVGEGQLRVGVNGNSNQLIDSARPNNFNWNQNTTKITLMFNNGNNNSGLSPNTAGNRTNTLSNTSRPRDNTAQMNHMMQGMMGMGWGTNYGQFNPGNYQHANNYQQYYQPPYQMQMQAPLWGMQMFNPFQATNQSSMHQSHNNFNPFNQPNTTYNGRNFNWNEPTIDSNSNYEENDQPTRHRSGGSSNRNNNQNRRGEYRFDALDNNGRTRWQPGPNRRSRNVSHQQQPVVIRISDDEDQEIEELPYFGQRSYQFQPNRAPVRYAFNLNESVPGLSEDEVSVLPRSQHKGKAGKCSICLDDMTEGHQVTFLFCFHAFHSECGMSWLRKSATCPLCQLDLRPHLETLK